MTIKEVETAVGLPRASIRYYESEGLISPSRGENGYRNYSERDLEDLKKIKLLRELDCPIEDIAAVKNGTRRLDDVLDACLMRLKGDRERIERAQTLCERIRSDRTSWERLEPERYADVAPAARFPEPEVRDVRHFIPFRRYFARMLDYALCNLVWIAILALLRVNPAAGGAWELVLDILGTVVSLLLMLAAEPIFLSKLGTTPGKALLGLKLTRSDGSLLSYHEAARRTANVIIFGMGLNLPVVALITNILAYRRCRNEWGQPWENEDEAWDDFAAKSPYGFWSVKGSRLRAAGFVAANLLRTLAAVGLVFVAARPVHTGSLTIAEFAENYNQYCDFIGLEPSDERMADDGTPERGANVGYADAAGFEYETEGDLLKAVTYTYTAPVKSADPVRSMVVIPADRITAMMSAFTGHGAVALGEWKNVIDNVTRPREGTYSASGDGWSVTCTLETEGYIPVDGVWFLAEDGQDEYRFLYRLCVERTS